MRWSNILAVTGTLFLLVAKREVQARNYLWSALGLEEESHDGRILVKRNAKTRARIADTRHQKKEARREVDAVVGKRFDDSSQANAQYASDTISIVETEDVESSETEVGNKKSPTLGHNLRAKVAKAVKADLDEVTTQSVGKEAGLQKKAAGGKRKYLTADHSGGTVSHETRARQRLDRTEANKRKELNVEKREKEHEAKTADHSGGTVSHKTRARQRLDRTEANKRKELNVEKREKEHEAKKGVDVTDVTTRAGESHVEAKAIQTKGGGTQLHHKTRAAERLDRVEAKKRAEINEEKRTMNRQKKQAEASAVIEHVTLRDGGLAETPISVGTMSMDTTGVDTPVVSLYWGIFNNPDECPQQPCKLEDALDPYTKASLLHGTAGFPDAFGKVTLVSSIYRTPEYQDYSGSALLDGLATKTGGAFTSAGFYNNEAEVLVAIRKVISAESDTMAKLLESTAFSDSLDLSEDFVQIATFKAGQSGFKEIYSVGSANVVAGAKAHLTRQNDVMQIYVETNVNEYNIS
jgi:hypothetical protein